MEKKQFRIDNFLGWAIWCIAVVFLGIISLLNFLLTTVLSDGYKGPYVVKIAPKMIILLTLVTVIFIFFLYQHKEIKIKQNTIITTVFLVGLCESIFWIFIADADPVFDSLDLVYATEALKGSSDGLAIGKWGYAGYLSRFPYQTSIVCLLYFCMTIAGENYVILYELINCFACAFAMTGVILLTGESSDDSMCVLLSGIMAVFFFPMILYCTFIYGNIIALTFLIYSFYWQKRALSEKKILYVIVSICLMGLAITVKSTMIIGALAESLVYLLWMVKKITYKSCLICILCIICTMNVGKLFFIPINSFIKTKVDINLNEGVPSVAWITMGLGGGTEYRADIENNKDLTTNIDNAGYFDGFVWALPNTEYSKDAMDSLSKKYLVQRIRHFAVDPSLMIRFLVEKFVIEWTNPDFESFLASNWDSVQANGYNQAEREMTRYGESFYYGKAHAILFCVMDIMQTILSLGVFWLLLFDNKEKVVRLVELITVLGYIAVYILWENKTQYMFPAYFLMIPMASKGWKLACHTIAGKIRLCRDL